MKREFCKNATIDFNKVGMIKGQTLQDRDI
jgi:hypothetical protein